MGRHAKLISRNQKHEKVYSHLPCVLRVYSEKRDLAVLLLKSDFLDNERRKAQ